MLREEGSESPARRQVVREDDPVVEGAHDLMQPLATISALACLLSHANDVPPAVLARIEDIAAEAKLASEICQRMVVDRTPADRVQIHRLVAAAARSAAARHDVNVGVLASFVTVRGDRVALRRALDNLLENACRAAGPGGRVDVRITKGERARVEVHDSGQGFGSGPGGVASLGLGIVRRVVDEHAGVVTITESHLGGACVAFEIPLHRRPVAGVTSRKVRQVPLDG